MSVTIGEVVTVGEFGDYKLMFVWDGTNWRKMIGDASGILSVNVEKLADVDTVYDYGTGKRSLLVARSHGKNTFQAEYATAQTNTVIITCTSSQCIDSVSVYISGDGAAGEARVIWACSRELIFPLYLSKTNQGTAGEMHNKGLAGESVHFTTTTGTDKVFVLVLYRIVDAEAADFPELTVADWQKNPATGTATNVAYTNDNETTNVAVFDAIDEYAEVEFDEPFFTNKFRHYGFVQNQEDGLFKLQYFDCDTQAWIDWELNIATRKVSWSDWVAVTPVMTKKVRIVATTIDSGIFDNACGEWEMKYEA